MDGRAYKALENPEALNYALAQLRKLGIPAVEFIVEKGLPKLGYKVKSRETGQFQIQYRDYTKVSMYNEIPSIIYTGLPSFPKRRRYSDH
uniref:hypothetical protein n=1 Tax=Clostridium sp. NkU-1 TaxID=1095009 RepID=UPI00326172DD